MKNEYRINPIDLVFAPGSEIDKEALPKRLQALREAQALALDIPCGDILKIKQQIEERYGLSLKDRGEAHMTLIRPVQMKILRDGLVSVEDLAAFDSCVNQPVEIVGVGTIPENLDMAGVQAFLEQEKQAEVIDSKKNKPKGVAFFAVIRLPAVIQARLDVLIDSFNAKEPNPKKQLPKTEPHVTIGFTLKDRFDGSKKAVNPNINVEIPVTKYETITAQIPAKNENGDRIKGLDGNDTYEYKPV